MIDSQESPDEFLSRKILQGAQTIEKIVNNGDIKKAYLKWDYSFNFTRKDPVSGSEIKIPSEVVLHALEYTGVWCGYLYLSKDLFCSFGLDGKIIYYKLVLESLKGEYPEVFYLHGGCTYLRLEEDNETLKIGCDFAHYHDMDKIYGVSDVLCEMQSSVISLEDLLSALVSRKPDASVRGFFRKVKITSWKVKELLILKFKIHMISCLKDLRNIVVYVWDNNKYHLKSGK